MKPDNVTTDRFVFYSSAGVSSDFLVIAVASDRIYTAVDNVYSAINKRSSNTLTAGNWYHVVVTKTTGNIENIYVNGVDATEDGNDFYSDADGAVTTFGGSVNNTDFDGILDEVRVYNSVLSAAEIQALYNSGR